MHVVIVCTDKSNWLNTELLTDAKKVLTVKDYGWELCRTHTIDTGVHSDLRASKMYVRVHASCVGFIVVREQYALSLLGSSEESMESRSKLYVDKSIFHSYFHFLSPDINM